MTKARGDRAEDLAQQWLEARGWRLLMRNYRWAQGPGRPGGEIDLIALDPGQVLVFVEVRMRSDARHGGALPSISTRKQERICATARHFLSQHPHPALQACRFDVLILEAGQWQWIPGAFMDEAV